MFVFYLTGCTKVRDEITASAAWKGCLLMANVAVALFCEHVAFVMKQY